MAYGNRTGGKVLMFNFKNLKKEDDEAIIEIYDPAKGEVVDNATYVEGMLYDITFGKAEYKEDEFKTVKVKLVDGDERYIVSFGFKGSITRLARNVLNKLLSCSDFNQIKISYFGRKDEWKNVSVTCNGKEAEYYLSLEEIKSLKKEYKDDKGKIIKTDYTSLNEYLESKINEIIRPLFCKLPDVEETKEEPKDKPEPEVKHENQEEYLPEPDNTNDIPF